MGKVTKPIRFDGSAEEAVANFRSHQWVQFGPDDAAMCAVCDTAPGRIAADYPCGAVIPREDINEN